MLLAGHQSKLIHWRISLGKSAPTIFEASRNVSWRSAYDGRNKWKYGKNNYKPKVTYEGKEITLEQLELRPKQIFKI